jgi:hypothetical protein
VRALPSERPAPELWGVPVAVTAAWDATKGDAIVADWSKLVVGIRADIAFDLSTDGVLLDDAGVIQVSAFQDDVTVRLDARRQGTQRRALELLPAGRPAASGLGAAAAGRQGREGVEGRVGCTAHRVREGPGRSHSALALAVWRR